MSVTIHDIPAETVGFKPERTRSGKIVLSLFILSLLAYIVVLFAIGFKMQHVLEFKTEATIATIASISVFCFIFLQMLLKGNWLSTTDKDGKTYVDKLQEFYDKIPGRDALNYERVSSYKTFPNTEQDERTNIETLSFGSATLHRRKKILRGLKNVRYPKNISIAEESQASGLPDRLKLMR